MVQALATEKATRAAKEATARERKPLLQSKRKSILSADPFNDIYLFVFHVGASFKMLRDPDQLEAWWKEKNEREKPIKDVQNAPIASEDERQRRERSKKAFLPA